MYEKHSFLTTEQCVLLDMLSQALSGKGVAMPSSDVLTGSLWFEAYIQAVLLLAFNGVSVDSFAEEQGNKMRQMLKDDFQKNIAVDNAHIELHQMMQKEGIPYVILKGMAAAAYYPDMLMRSMGDVDFLVKNEDIKRVCEILESNGFVAREKTNSHHITFDSREVRMEVHFEPPGIPDNASGDIIREYFEDIFDLSVNIETELGNVNVPSVFHHGLVILLHNAHHLTGDGLGLRHLCDWAVFINSLSDDEFYDIFEEKLKKAGLWHFALLLSQTSRMYLGISARAGSEIKDKHLSEQLISDIFSSGNFGQKNEDRSHESLLMSDKKKRGGSLISMIISLVKSINSVVYSNWSFVKKFRILLPLGWVFFSGRYIIRSLRGQRPAIRVRSVFSEAEKRRNFYAELKLFDAE